MALDGALGEEQLGRDLGIGQPRGHQRQDLLLAGSQRPGPHCPALPARRRNLAGADSGDDGRQRALGVILENDSLDAQLERAAHVGHDRTPADQDSRDVPEA